MSQIPADDTAPGLAVRDDAAIEPADRHARILIIDDNRQDALLMSRFLGRRGYETRQAESGETGLEMLRDDSYDCVLVDYRMPGMNGFEVCRQIKADPELQQVPVLMLTGAESARSVVDGLESGADDFVTKSSEVEVILARVGALLRVKAYQDRIVEQSSQLRRLYEEVKEKSDRIMALNQKLNDDLQFARRVQESLLPDRSFSGDGFDVRSTYVPSETLSGDFYDYFVRGNQLFLFIADVSGHGVPAAILVSLLKSYLHSEVTSAPSLARFMSDLNDFLCTASLPSQYATAQLFRFDRERSTLTFSSAAHPPFLLRRTNRETEVYEYPGLMLGSLRAQTWEEQTIEIREGDTLICYTDGMTDRRTGDGTFYSIDRLSSILDERRDLSVDDLWARLHADVTEFPSTDEFKDDLALIMTRVGATPG